MSTVGVCQLRVGTLANATAGIWATLVIEVLLNFLVTVKAALHECVIRTGLP